MNVDRDAVLHDLAPDSRIRAAINSSVGCGFPGHRSRGRGVEFAKRHPGLRVVEGRFTAIEQAMGTPKQRDAGSKYLAHFIDEMKASGFVASALARSGQHDAAVAPPLPRRD